MEDKTGASGTTVEPPAEQPQDWYFTFGGDHTLPTGESLKNAYLVLHGTYDFARDQMFELFGNRWSFQYASAQGAGVERYALSELVIPEVTR